MKFTAIISILILLITCQFFACSKTEVIQSGKYTYETVKDDPLKARIYTLDNGLKVYMTVYKDEPRIQTMIPIRVGSKNDPAESTGLAHYLEHLLFKGTDKYSTNEELIGMLPLSSFDSGVYGLYERYFIDIGKDEGRYTPWDLGVDIEGSPDAQNRKTIYTEILNFCREIN